MSAATQAEAVLAGVPVRYYVTPYQCAGCGSLEVEVSYPAWYDWRGDHVEDDPDADPLHYHCAGCG